MKAFHFFFCSLFEKRVVPIIRIYPVKVQQQLMSALLIPKSPFIPQVLLQQITPSVTTTNHFCAKSKKKSSRNSSKLASSRHRVIKDLILSIIMVAQHLSSHSLFTVARLYTKKCLFHDIDVSFPLCPNFDPNPAVFQHDKSGTPGSSYLEPLPSSAVQPLDHPSSWVSVLFYVKNSMLSHSNKLNKKRLQAPFQTKCSTQNAQEHSCSKHHVRHGDSNKTARRRHSKSCYPAEFLLCWKFQYADARFVI